MALNPGTRLGAYEIVGSLGAGGMGEVYRARDTRLKREVAIKVLSDTFSTDVDRLARFQREAELLASLNHPNIAAAYGLEQLPDGSSAIVLELVDGPTLADRIAQGPIPLDEALPIARQIAEALETAHDKGVIHRDLKPANIKVTLDGGVKVLDFGLAKMMETEVSPAALSKSPTLSVHATYAGVILGTAAYMSPEQARGKPVDRRTDIWAFGCVLFEMLSGRQTFDSGETVSDAVAAILKNDPDWSALPEGTPPHVRRLLTRCLQKDPKRRLPHIGVARLEIEEPDPEAVAVRAHGSRRPVWKAVGLVAATVLATLAAVGAGFWVASRPAPAPIVGRFSIRLADGQLFSGTSRKFVAISPDGTNIAYLASDRLFVRAIGELEPRAVPGAEGNLSVLNPVFSPDGQWVAFFSPTDNSLKRVAVRGGSVVTIAPVGSAPFGMSWGPDGIVLVQAGGGILRVSPNGGAVEELLSAEADSTFDAPQMLPDGNTLLFTVAKGTDFDRWDKAQVVVQSLSSGARRVVVDGGSDARYVPSGHLIYASGGTLFAVAFDNESQQVTGESAPVVSGVRRSVAPGGQPGGAQFSVSDNGSLVYIPGPVASAAASRLLVVTDRHGVTATLKVPPGPYVHPRVSPDGRQLVFGRDDPRESEIWIHDLDEATATRRLTFGGRNRFPIWSADGKRVTFQSDRDGDRGIFWQAADGGVVERLTTSEKDVAHVPEAWSPDGKYLLYSSVKGTAVSLHLFALNEKKATAFGDVESQQPVGAVFSPDGRWVAYTFVERFGDTTSRNRGVYLQPFPATGAKFQVPKISIDYHPAWSRDGKELFFVPAASRPIAAVTVQTTPRLTFGSPAELSKTPVPGLLGTEARGFDVLRDGRLVVVVPAAEPGPSGARNECRVVLNWFEDLKRLAPVP